MSHKLVEWASDKAIAFLSPYDTPRGMRNSEIVNGITGVPFTFKENEGVDYYSYHDIKNLSKEELLKIFNKYEYWIYPVFPEYFDMLATIREDYKGKIIGVTDIQTHILSYWSLDDTSKFIDAMRMYDVIMSTNADEVETFRGCLRDPKKIEYTGWCLYPDTIHKELYKPSTDRDKNLISVAISNPGDFNRDLLTNLEVYKRVKKAKPSVKGFMYYVTPNKTTGLGRINKQMGVEDFTLVPELGYIQAMEYLSKAYIGIHLYTFKVVGRLAQDCAALGIPLVGTIANLPNRLCFPKTSTIDYDVRRGTELAIQLLEDEDFWLETSAYAKEFAFKFYGLEGTRNRIYKLLEQNELV